MPKRNADPASAGQDHGTAEVALRVAAAAVSVLVLAFSSGCASSGLNAARSNFYAGRLDAALTNLQQAAESPGVDRVLVLMERGAVQQALGNHAAAVRDWVAASRLSEELNYYSVGRNTASFVANDSVQAYRGAPFERTLARALCSVSYMMMGLWDDAAVEARNIAAMQDDLEGFPDDAFSHYVAGLAFQMIDDENNARIEFGRAAGLLKDVPLDPEAGRTAGQPPGRSRELVVFAGLGRPPRGRYGTASDAAFGADPHVEVIVDGRTLGRSHAFSNTQKLMIDTEDRLAAMRATKTVSRIALKEALAQSIERQNRPLGELIRIILFALETPDGRRWETVPLWLQVGRFAIPADVKEVEVVFRGGGRIIDRRRFAPPLPTRRDTSVIFTRSPP